MIPMPTSSPALSETLGCRGAHDSQWLAASISVTAHSWTEPIDRTTQRMSGRHLVLLALCRG